MMSMISPVDLALATYDQLIDELKTRFDGMLFVGRRPASKVGSETESILIWDRGPANAHGLASYAAARLGHVINCQNCIDASAQTEEDEDGHP